LVVFDIRDTLREIINESKSWVGKFVRGGEKLCNPFLRANPSLLSKMPITSIFVVAFIAREKEDCLIQNAGSI
jgi:hypothetical protein